MKKVCKNLKLIALAIDENFSALLASLTSALWDRVFFSFYCVKFYRLTTSRTSTIMPCKIQKNPIIKSKMIFSKISNNTLS